MITSLVGGWATCPWKVQASVTSLTTFLSGYVIVLAPIIAIMVTDYWVVRGGRLDVPGLYQNEGRYRYHRGLNWRALATLLIVVPVNLPGLIHAINARVSVGTAYVNFYKASWLTSTFMAATAYLALSVVFPAKSGVPEAKDLEIVDPNIPRVKCRQDQRRVSQSGKSGHLQRLWGSFSLWSCTSQCRSCASLFRCRTP
jgi:nucleobase:cation symporter-1, NCS1 family